MPAGVLEAMQPWLGSAQANASSLHSAGQTARRALERSREQMAIHLGCKPSELIFTSGGSESINTALRGLSDPRRMRLLTSQAEHHATLHCADFNEGRGADVLRLAVDQEGALDSAAFDAWLREPTERVRVASLMQANNETGVLHDLAPWGQRLRSAGILFHIDAVQAFGKVAVKVADLGADLLSISAHKFGGPQGCGLLYLRDGVKLRSSLLLGGAQEAGRRAGTENVSGAVGMAAAASLALEQLKSEQKRLGVLRDQLEAKLKSMLPGLKVHGEGSQRLGQTSSLYFPGCENQALLLALDREGFEVSTGSACASGAPEPSHVLRAMGLAGQSRGVIRVSLGPQSQASQLDAFAQAAARLGQVLAA